MKYLYVLVQGFKWPQWLVVLLECLRWDMHAVGLVFSVVWMLLDMYFGTHSIQQRKQMALLQTTW